MRMPFLGGAYQAFSKTFADNRCINLFVERAREAGKTTGAFFRTPGYTLLCTCGVGPIRGIHVMPYNGSEIAFVASGNQLYSFTNAFVPTLLGAIDGTGPVSMADNGTQVFVACNPHGFIWNQQTAAFAQIVSPNFLGASTVAFIDGYFVYSVPNTQDYGISALYDGLTYAPLDFGTVEGAPGPLLALTADHNELWLFKDKSIEVHYDSGNPDFPFQRIQGAFIEYGCAAPFSVAKIDNTVFWLGQDPLGYGVIYRAIGYTPKVISTYAINQAISTYSKISDAYAFCYQEKGHLFYQITFPTADGILNGQTWVYDAVEDEWHERAYLNAGVFEMHRASSHGFFNGDIHLIGDRANGNVYDYSTAVYQDAGQPNKWLRSWRAIPSDQNTLQRVQHKRVDLDAQMGFGIQGAPATPSTVDLAWSDDGGFNFKPAQNRSLGIQGATQTRVYWNKLGKSRDRVYQLSSQDNAKFVLLSTLLNEFPG